MAQFQSALSGLLTSVQNGEGVDLVRESVRIVLQELVDAEAIAVIPEFRSWWAFGRV